MPVLVGETRKSGHLATGVDHKTTAPQGGPRIQTPARLRLAEGPCHSGRITFAQLGLGDGRVNQIGGYLGGGLTLTAPFPSRAQDALGLAVAAARNGSHYERAQAAAGAAAAGETTVELTYLAQLGSWLTVQPDVQYVVHPGGTGAARNAVVVGLRVAVSD